MSDFIIEQVAQIDFDAHSENKQSFDCIASLRRPNPAQENIALRKGFSGEQYLNLHYLGLV